MSVTGRVGFVFGEEFSRLSCRHALERPSLFLLFHLLYTGDWSLWDSNVLPRIWAFGKERALLSLTLKNDLSTRYFGATCFCPGMGLACALEELEG